MIWLPAIVGVILILASLSVGGFKLRKHLRTRAIRRRQVSALKLNDPDIYEVEPQLGPAEAVRVQVYEKYIATYEHDAGMQLDRKIYMQTALANRGSNSKPAWVKDYEKELGQLKISAEITQDKLTEYKAYVNQIRNPDGPHEVWYNDRYQFNEPPAAA